MATLAIDKSIPVIQRVEAKVPTILWLNDARIFAALAIVFIHVSGNALAMLNNAYNYNWWISNFYLSSVGWCVPVFVMISGMLLLDPRKDESMIDFYKKRASKVFIPIVFWSLFFVIWTYLNYNIVTHNPVSLGYLGKKLLLGESYSHMWFFYMIFGLYLFTPFIRKIVRLSSYRELMFLCITLFAFSIVGQAVITYYGNPIFPTIFWSVFFLPYFLAGYLINAAKTSPRSVYIYVLIILSIMLSGLGNYFFSRSGELHDMHLYFRSCVGITFVGLSIGVMLLLKKYSVSVIPPKLSNVILPLTMGICLIHPVFTSILKWFGIIGDSYTLFAVPLITIAVCIVSVVACMIIMKIPLVKKII